MMPLRHRRHRAESRERVGDILIKTGPKIGFCSFYPKNLFVPVKHKGNWPKNYPRYRHRSVWVVRVGFLRPPRTVWVSRVMRNRTTAMHQKRGRSDVGICAPHRISVPGRSALGPHPRLVLVSLAVGFNINFVRVRVLLKRDGLWFKVQAPTVGDSFWRHSAEGAGRQVRSARKQNKQKTNAIPVGTRQMSKLRCPK